MPGKYRHRIAIQEDTGATEDAHGGLIESWGDKCDAWAEIDTGASRKYYAAKQVHSELTHLVTIRYRADLSASGKYRIVWGSRTLNLLGPVVDRMGMHEELEFQCAEEVA